MNFSQFLYSTIQVGIGVVIGWLLSLIGQLKMQKRQHYFELEKLKIERTEPYKERIYNLKFEAYSHIWAKCMECWREFYHKQWIFQDVNTSALFKAFNNFSFEFSSRSIILEKSVVENIQYLIANFDNVYRYHSMLCRDQNNTELRKRMEKYTEKSLELLDKLAKEMRKDLKLLEIEKGLAETFYPKELDNNKEPKI